MDKTWLVVPLAGLTLLGAACASAPVQEPVAAAVVVEVTPAAVEQSPAEPAPMEEVPLTEEQTFGDTFIESHATRYADTLLFEGEIGGMGVSLREGEGFHYLRVADSYGPDVLFVAREDWTIPRDPVECVYISAGDRVQSYCDSEGVPAWAGEYPPFRIIADKGSDSTTYSTEELGDYVDTLVAPVMESAQQRYLSYIELIEQYDTLQKDETLLPYQRVALDAIEK